jgi:protein tyrosine kinase modulator
VQETESEGDFSQTLDRLFGILTRRRWIIIGTTCVIALGAIAISFRIPNQYTSEAIILVVQQQVSERYVAPTSTSQVGPALEAMTHDILSRPRLLGIINELGLYPKQKTRFEPDQLFEMMRHDVSIEPLLKPGQRDLNTFQISFTAATPHLAQQVTSRLTTLFIEENLKTRTDQATTTTGFLHEQLETAKSKLIEQEQRLRDFKTQYLGELPEQQQGNLGILTGLQTQLDNVMSNRNKAQQQRLYLESLLNDQRQRKHKGSVATVVSSDGHIVTPLEASQQDLARLQAERRTLLTTYTAQHPDVLKKDQEIKAQQAFIEGLRPAKASGSAPPTPATNYTQDAEDDIGVVQLRSQLQVNTLEIDNLAKKEQKLRADIDQYQTRLNLTPVREQQLMSIQRDYELLRQHYGDLLKKEQESQLATNLERRQEGQQFRLADPPNLPNKPSSPNRMKISLIALAVGLGVGCGLALLAEMRNSSFYTEASVAGRVTLPLIVGIPLLVTPTEQRARSWRNMLEWFAGSAVALIVLIAEVYVFRHG